MSRLYNNKESFMYLLFDSQFLFNFIEIKKHVKAHPFSQWLCFLKSTGSIKSAWSSLFIENEKLIMRKVP